MVFWFWLGAIVFFGVVEGVTAGLVSIWFVLGAAAALIAALLNAALAVQFAVFLIVSALALVATRPLVKAAGRKARPHQSGPGDRRLRTGDGDGGQLHRLRRGVCGRENVDRPQRGRLHPAQGADGPDRKNGGRKALC